MKRRKPLWHRIGAAAFFLGMNPLLPAQSPPAGEIPGALWEGSVSLDSPDWFGPVQTAVAANMTVWRASVRPPSGQSRLAVTLVFDETQGGFARLIWQGPGRAVTVCGNLYEGAAPLHARTLLLDRETLAGPGQLVFEATGTRPALLRAELSWVEPLVLAASGWKPPGLYLAPSGKIFPADELHGQGRRAPVDERKGRVLDAVLDAGPVKVLPQTTVRFIAPMAATPSRARVEAQVAGLGPGEEPVLWVNGRPVTAVAVELPGLDDPGYRWTAGTGDWAYGGWRTVTAHVPQGWMGAGENNLDWQSPFGSTGMTLRHLRLQVAYDTGVPIPVPAPTPAPVRPVPAAIVPAPVLSSVPHPLPRPSSLQFRLGLSSSSGGLGLRPE